MSFLLGTTCWHVVGYVNGKSWNPRLLCGWVGNEYAIGGDAVDVVRSEMPVCGSCDRAASGNARSFVAEVAREMA